MKCRFLPIAATLLLCSCAEDAPPPQPAPPPDRNFTATVNDQPVVGGTRQYECVINTSNESGKPQFMLTFNDDVGHAIQVGIARGTNRPGNRKILYGMATSEGRAYGRPSDASANLTAIDVTDSGAIVSGRFDVQFELVNAAPGIIDQEPLRISHAVFEQVQCIEPQSLRAATKG